MYSLGRLDHTYVPGIGMAGETELGCCLSVDLPGVAMCITYKGQTGSTGTGSWGTRNGLICIQMAGDARPVLGEGSPPGRKVNLGTRDERGA